MGKTKVGIIILAAGLGKRMRSNLPKVLHEIGGQPLVFHTLDRIRETAPDASIAVVVGHGREQVESAIRGNPRYADMDIRFVLQSEQKGTGHAARCAVESPWGAEIAVAKAPVLVLPGDSPLLPGSLIEGMVAPLKSTAALRLLTCVQPDPTGYGRVIRKGKGGPVQRIVEEKDADAKQKSVREVAASIYLFQAEFLRKALPKLTTRNAQGEYYLTDLVAAAATAKRAIDVLEWPSAEDLRGVNDPWELAEAGAILSARVNKAWCRKGVKIVDPRATWIDVHVELGDGVVVEPGAILRGETRVGAGARIGAHVVLEDMEIGEDANVKAGTYGERSRIGARAQVGPYAHFRPDSEVGAEAKIGNFVELKKTKIGERTSVAHLSYLGDAEVGRDVNIGCGFVTCNFDGRVIDGQRKHRTVIEDGVFLGSDCQTVAPVRVGRGAYVASGSTITEDVPDHALAIARSRQVNKPGYARKLRAEAEPSAAGSKGTKPSKK